MTSVEQLIVPVKTTLKNIAVEPPQDLPFDPRSLLTDEMIDRVSVYTGSINDIQIGPTFSDWTNLGILRLVDNERFSDLRFDRYYDLVLNNNGFEDWGYGLFSLKTAAPEQFSARYKHYLEFARSLISEQEKGDHDGFHYFYATMALVFPREDLPENLPQIIQNGLYKKIEDCKKERNKFTDNPDSIDLFFMTLQALNVKVLAPERYHECNIDGQFWNKLESYLRNEPLSADENHTLQNIALMWAEKIVVSREETRLVYPPEKFSFPSTPQVPQQVKYK